VTPTNEEIRALHERFAPTSEAFELVYTHCQIVAAVAEQLLLPETDVALVRAGALLHDIGVYRLYDDDGKLEHDRYIQHGLLGDEMLGEIGLPMPLRRICSHHTGVGLSRRDVVSQHLPLPEADYLAESPEEELVMYADKFHSKTSPPVFLTAATYAAKVSRFGPEKVAKFAELHAKFGEPDLRPLIAAYGHALA
jgi:uncharacterized protein